MALGQRIGKYTDGPRRNSPRAQPQGDDPDAAVARVPGRQPAGANLPILAVLRSLPALGKDPQTLDARWKRVCSGGKTVGSIRQTLARRVASTRTLTHYSPLHSGRMLPIMLVAPPRTALRCIALSTCH